MKARRAVLGGLLLVALTRCSVAEPTKGKTYLTPKAVFDAAKAAAQKDDFKTFFACLTPDSQKMMAGQMVLGGLMMKGFAESGLDKSGNAQKRSSP